jgi:putrescine transport system substrate-binding protein
VLETKLLAGSTGYDIVVPSASFLERQIKAGVFQKLDKSKLPNLANLDPEIMERVGKHDPGNEYAVNYLWGTTGIGYNGEAKIRARRRTPIDSWAMIFDPANRQEVAGLRRDAARRAGRGDRHGPDLPRPRPEQRGPRGPRGGRKSC